MSGYFFASSRVSASPETELADLRIRLAKAEADLASIRASTFWRATLPLQQVINRLRAASRRKGQLRRQVLPDGIADYATWVAECDTLTEEDRLRIGGQVQRMAYKPLISVVMPVFDTAPALLTDAINSVLGQLYPYWELCIADDASTAPHVVAILAERSSADSRIRWTQREVNGHISAASNTALAMARGEFVALLDHDDRLAPQALYEVAALLQRHPDADIVFSDEDRIDEQGVRSLPYFKPGWDQELLLGHNYVNHLGVYRRPLLEELGGFRTGLEGSQDYDLILRAAARSTAERIHHIPAVLYHWRLPGNGSFSETNLARCVAAARRAIEDHLTALPGGAGAVVEPNPAAPEHHRIRWPLPATPPRVSVLIPTRNRAPLLDACTEGLLRRTAYPNMEILIVDNGSDEEDALSLLTELTTDARVRLLRQDGPFNFAALCNRAATEATGSILLLLNNDVEVLEPDWLTEMVSHALRPGVGTVGAKLLYTDRRIQHAGVVLGIGSFDGGPGIGAHFAEGDPETAQGYFRHSALTRSVSANTAACLAVRREAFLAVGGLDELNLAVEYNDVDICLRLSAQGLRHIWTPFVCLLHHERASRGADNTPEAMARSASENRYMRQRWGSILDADPHYNPNFSRLRQRYELCRPSRRVAPWRLAPSP